MLSLIFMEERLQKILSRMGVASRRKSEEMIEEGRVTVNGKVAVLGQKADAGRDHIKLDGKLLSRPSERKLYLALNKPVNVLTTLDEEEDRPTVRQYLKHIKERVYPIGRLDFDTEGLLLFTNDGELAHAVTHPSKKVSKTYRVKIKGALDDNAAERLRRGIRLEDGNTAPAQLKRLRLAEANSWVEIAITEGRKRQIRRMLQAVGHPVIKLIRVSIDGVKLGRMSAGQIRELSNEEVKRLKYSAGFQREGR